MIILYTVIYEKYNILLLLFVKPSSLNEINRILGNMADGMKGCDELPAKFFKDNFAILRNFILDICNCSLSNGTFPDALINDSYGYLFVQSKYI